MSDQERLAQYQWVLQGLQIAADAAAEFPETDERTRGYKMAWRAVAWELERLILPPITPAEHKALPRPDHRVQYWQEVPTHG